MGHSCDNGRDSQSYRAQANGGLRKRNVSSAVRTTQGVVSSSPPQPPPAVARPTPGRNMSMEANISEHRSGGQRTVIDRKASAKQKYALLPDNFTTLEQVCFQMNCEPKIPLELLTNDEARDLFKNRAGLTNKDSDILPIAIEISDKCKGLPIAIVAVAISLKGKTRGDWDIALNNFRDREPVRIENGVANPYNCLKSSYDNLKDNQAQKLFLLCSLFPEDSEIQIEYLIRSGIGLGIFRKTLRSQMWTSKVLDIIRDMYHMCQQFLMFLKVTCLNRVQVHQIVIVISCTQQCLHQSNSASQTHQTTLWTVALAILCQYYSVSRILLPFFP